jgi:hypothetical protein
MTFTRSTGISSAAVERIEISLKRDVIRELYDNDGKLLLHDEMETEPGTFEIVPQWVKVTEDDILTPREVFDMIINEGYKVYELYYVKFPTQKLLSQVDYARIPVVRFNHNPLYPE